MHFFKQESRGSKLEESIQEGNTESEVTFHYDSYEKDPESSVSSSQAVSECL